MKLVHVCVPVLRRYDLLRKLLFSLKKSTVQPDMICVLDNGRLGRKLTIAIDHLELQMPIHVVTPEEPFGVAASWNWFLRNIPEERVIVNDDVEFAETSLERILAVEGDFVGCLPGEAFSCFLIRDSCVKKVGVFDESISPGYAYFEDCDYAERIEQVGAIRRDLVCDLLHGHSKTLEAASLSEQNEHQRRFLIAQSNFMKKWGRMPKGVMEQYG